MSLYDNKLYLEDINSIIHSDLNLNELRDKTFLITGATGLIGSVLVDALLELNIGIKIYAMVRNEQRARERFVKWNNNGNLVILKHDVVIPCSDHVFDGLDYVLHLASNTHPKQYSTDPIGTIETNIIGLKNMLDMAVEYNVRRLLFASSVEVYGENRGDTELFDEGYCGYINANTMRAGYPESKRCGEALCQAYRSQKGVDTVIARLARTYGPSMSMSDSRAIGQFIRKGICGEDIVLKSAGTQFYSYEYVTDSVLGVLTILLGGTDGEAYNIADEQNDITLKELAGIIADINGKKVVFEIPDASEAAGYSTATKARMDGSKLKELGWTPNHDIKEGMERTIRILKEIQN